MENIASGSNFSQFTIRRLKQFSLELDIYLTLKCLRFFKFSQEKKILIELKTLKPVEIKNESQCIFKASDDKFAYVSVGSFDFVVKKSEITSSLKT